MIKVNISQRAYTERNKSFLKCARKGETRKISKKHIIHPRLIWAKAEKMMWKTTSISRRLFFVFFFLWDDGERTPRGHFGNLGEKPSEMLAGLSLSRLSETTRYEMMRRCLTWDCWWVGPIKRRPVLVLGHGTHLLLIIELCLSHQFREREWERDTNGKN